MKMKRLHANVGSRNTALEKRPEVLKAISVYAAIYILRGVIYHLMCIIRSQAFIGEKGIGVESRASSDVLVYFFLQCCLATAGGRH